MLSRVFGFGRRSFDSLSEQEILALAISSEEDDGRIYRAYADGLAQDFPQSAKVFEAMAEEEDGHRDSLIELHRKRFGDRIPLIRREHVRGYYERKPDWLVRPLGIEHVRRQAEDMERQAYR
ncbi:MAG: rubrerythrin family protein, partial [Mesorhizobium sp.]